MNTRLQVHFRDESMPMYDPANRWKRKSKIVYWFILVVGVRGIWYEDSYYLPRLVSETFIVA